MPDRLRDAGLREGHLTARALPVVGPLEVVDGSGDADVVLRDALARVLGGS